MFRLGIINDTKLVVSTSSSNGLNINSFVPLLTRLVQIKLHNAVISSDWLPESQRVHVRSKSYYYLTSAVNDVIDQEQLTY